MKKEKRKKIGKEWRKPTLKTEKRKMRNEKKTCFDCLHCKVSAKSTQNCRLCFCAETRAKAKHKEPYWLNKKLCENFEDMTA